MLNTGISTALGLGLGYLGVRLAKPVEHLRRHTVVAIALGNLGNLPLVIVSSLASSSASILHGIPPERAEDLAVSYVVLGLLIPCIAHATIGPGAAQVPVRINVLVNAMRLVLLPLLGLTLVMGAYTARLFEAPDPIYLLVLLIQNTAPTAIMVHTMASVQNNRPEEVSTILFWGYMAGILVIPLWLTLFLYAVKVTYRDTN
ncbi:hypothetical protein GPECTOR_2g1226 [Gonium pectorale]|uniref:Auxin efflux carrier n=1 Tax=Gonium pectorale TaxID=33097 RepID=A0A150H0I2_GONPE|nr:hypothetical protein GPECTOR_2g1226 [Gonium pectorale]|eukprot:KXZ55676.1 hypothetical protein GPECTOR_2g1226 [Gonium pectorale]